MGGGCSVAKKQQKKRKAQTDGQRRCLLLKKIAQKTIARCGVCVFHHKDRNSIERRFSCSVLSPSREDKKKITTKKRERVNRRQKHKTLLV